MYRGSAERTKALGSKASRSFDLGSALRTHDSLPPFPHLMFTI
jgi:hypothetical protein